MRIRDWSSDVCSSDRLEERRELAGQLPGLEEGRPVDDLQQVLQRVVVEDGDAGLLRLGRRVVVPAALEALRARFFQRHQPLGVAAVAVALADLGVVGEIGRALVCTPFSYALLVFLLLL